MHRFTYQDGARLLTSELALPDLSLADAMSIVPRMRLTLARPDAVLFRASGPAHQFLVLLLDGDAVVEGQLVGGKEPVVLRTLAPGRLSVLMKLERRLGGSSGGVDSVPPAGKP